MVILKVFCGFVVNAIRYMRVISVFNSLKLYFIETMLPKGTIYSVRIKKAVNPIYVRAKTSDGWLVRSIMVRDGGEYPVFENYSPNFIIDAGANIGIATVFFKMKYPNAKIVAIEPDEDNCKMFHKNTCNFKDVQLIRAGVGSVGNRVFRIKNQSDSSFSYQLEVEKEGDGVPEVTVDDILKMSGESQIDIFKIDIEGGEKDLFDRQCSWIERTQNIMIELHDQLEPGASKSVLNAVKSDFYLRSRGENFIFTRCLLGIKNSI